MEVRYRILQSREETYLVMNRMLLTNTESKTRIIFSIKNRLDSWKIIYCGKKSRDY